MWFSKTKNDAHTPVIEEHFSWLTSKASLLLCSQVIIEDLYSIDDEIIVHKEIDRDWEEKLLKDTLIYIDEKDEKFEENKESTELHSIFEEIDVNDI